MQNLQPLLLAIWREACQHIEIHESLAGIGQLLTAAMPLAELTILRFEAEHSVVATIAHTPSHDPIRATRQCPPATMKKLLAWVRRGAVAGGESNLGDAPILRTLGVSQQHDLRVLPLQSRGEAVGALILAAQSGTRFDAAHEALIVALQEPLAVALENDRRLHELAALREAAEADRRSLLRRLGRTDISDDIIGEQGGLAQVMLRANLVCRSDAPVLLLGETGSGKEVIARAVHNRSDRATGPFIRVNCGAIPPELIDSQLFGHEKGSFTGALETRLGWFERASGGTLFLDEIGELPLEAQVRLLRVLQDSLVERVGGKEPLRVDVRVIAATHRDLARMVQEGQFREDLWYRIAVFPILLPPLRERLGDIGPLAAHFAERAAVRFGLPAVAPTAEQIQLLGEYSWPGNIRELGAVIDRAAILGEGRRLEIAAALGFASLPARPPRAAETATADDACVASPPGSLDAAMKQHIERALQHARGQIEGPRGAARLLAINPHTLRARMRKLGIRWQAFRSAE